MTQDIDPTGATARLRYINPAWKARETPPEIGDWAAVEANTVQHQVKIGDARHLDCGLNTTGFCLIEHPSTTRNFRDDAELETTYFPELISLIGETTGADVVLVTDHFIRQETTQAYYEGYADFLHSDYSLIDPRAYFQRALKEQDIQVDQPERWEFACFNAWRPIERNVEQHPLVLIDTRTVARSDVIDYVYTGDPAYVTTESTATFAEAHRRFYFPAMRTDELLVFKQLDTRPGQAALCLHSAFEDPASPTDALGRRSLEVRLLCGFRGVAS